MNDVLQRRVSLPADTREHLMKQRCEASAPGVNR